MGNCLPKLDLPSIHLRIRSNCCNQGNITEVDEVDSDEPDLDVLSPALVNANLDLATPAILPTIVEDNEDL